ncbi:aldose 1-epimerase family protein [Microbacterium rhizophilus]|uniref:aldose 1-epimerase family protein n=1 Tax=Microbacterium rhizophilus TaxID=3138934 RepID=UPI0031E9E65C
MASQDTSRPASGEQVRLRRGDYAASIASVGATLRALEHGGRPLVVPFAADEVRPSFRGATLVPWPNRIVDGRYAFRGAQHQAALTEPSRGHALHGLGAWLDYGTVERRDDRVHLAATIQPQQGYPWRIRIDTVFALADDGLTQTVTATNLSPEPAPFGTAPHPYLVAGPGKVDDWALELPADRVALTEGERLLPGEVAGVEVDPERFDFRAPRRIGAVAVDHAFTALRRDPAGRATVRLTADDGSGVAMTWGPECAWLQIHTADLPGEPAHRVGLATEPMTCPPDAFNSGEDLVVLDPGASFRASWTITAL